MAAKFGKRLTVCNKVQGKRAAHMPQLTMLFAPQGVKIHIQGDYKMSYPVTVLEEGKIQIGGWVYTVKELKASWKLTYNMGNMEVVINVPKATAADVNELQAKLQEKF
mgnify:CR=1 FL=1